MKKKILFIFGTRPEAIKFAPLIKQFESSDKFQSIVCITAQHRQMLDQVLDFFSIRVDYDLNLMKPNQSLFQLSSNCLASLENIFEEVKPDLVFVQGDTTTVLMSALASFYKKVKIAHLEAGLRSNNKYSPFPEEINRVLTTHLADFHFAPTALSMQNLAMENIKDKVYVVGNTVIDALLLGLKIIKNKDEHFLRKFNYLDFTKRTVLVTCHRRENFGDPFINICSALNQLAKQNPNINIVYPVHLNPNIKLVAENLLKNIPNIFLIDPLQYPDLIWLMNKSYIIITDSGGIQEEAPALGKPVLVLREVTERIEGIEFGTAKLIGTNKDNIIKSCQLLLDDEPEYLKMAKAVNPYGDGTSSEKIVSIIETELV